MRGGPHARPLAARARLAALAVLLSALSLLADAPPHVLTADLSWGQVEIQVRAEPAEVQLERDLTVVVTVTAPASQMVEIPDLRDRFQGFTVAEGFSRDPVTLPDGRRSRETRWRLVPDLAREYRLAPFAVTVRDTTVVPPDTRSFPTRAVVFPAAPRDPAVAGEIEFDPKPYWIAPTRREMFKGGVLLGLGVVLVVFCLRLFRYLHRQARLRRLSPRERALVELDRLLRLRLLDQGLVKDFYIELTQVVRRYIERAHGIRAPEQTTEEFLASAREHPRFPPAVLGSLRDFLESADLIKFAGRAASRPAADQAVATARTYIERDAAAQASAPPTAAPSSPVSAP
jgi:hypothetical protein